MDALVGHTPIRQDFFFHPLVVCIGYTSAALQYNGAYCVARVFDGVIFSGTFGVQDGGLHIQFQQAEFLAVRVWVPRTIRGGPVLDGILDVRHGNVHHLGLIHRGFFEALENGQERVGVHVVLGQHSIELIDLAARFGGGRQIGGGEQAAIGEAVVVEKRIALESAFERRQVQFGEMLRNALANTLVKRADGGSKISFGFFIVRHIFPRGGNRDGTNGNFDQWTKLLHSGQGFHNFWFRLRTIVVHRVNDLAHANQDVLTVTAGFS